MKKTISALTAAFIVSSGMMTILNAEDSEVKRSLAGNMTLTYKKLPAEAETFSEIFTKGVVYGRLRSNTFLYDWTEETSTQLDNHAWGLGGSLIYKTAPFKGIGATVGAYYSNGSMYAMEQGEVGSVKSGKDVFSRLDVKNDNNYEMFSLAVANVDFNMGKTKVIIGRQIIESVFTKSNDTKMIPNTFEAAVIENKSIEGTTLRVAHITKQKLRDHTDFHDVVTYKDASGESWNNNDDSAIHKGLSYTNFTAAGKSTDHTLTMVTAKSKIGKNLKTEISYLMLPDVINNLTLEAHYTINAGTMKIIPGFRYMMQKDDGGGAIGGASLSGNVSASALRGYTVGDSLDSSLLCARVDIQPEGMFKYRIGYSQVADEADILAPWRGFPTGGFTRAMAQYNWTANTQTVMGRIDGKISKNVKFLVRYAVQDFDDTKTDVQADSSIIHTDWTFNMNAMVSGLELKLRAGLVSGGDKSGTKTDNSYNEYRVELNYLF